jgi:hypothetical protein
MDSMNTFQYQSLVGDGVRLTSQLPVADVDEAIRCKLHHASLKNLPSYEDLSYTWEDPEDKVSVFLEGGQKLEILPELSVM